MAIADTIRLWAEAAEEERPARPANDGGLWQIWPGRIFHPV